MGGFLDLINAGRNVNKAMAFIEDGSMSATLDTIADVEVEAAKLSLKQRQTAKNPTTYVHLALGHLQSAVVAYEKIVDTSKVARAVGTPYEREMAGLKGTWVACCSALCHYALGETENLRADLDRARNSCASHQLDTHHGRTLDKHYQELEKGGWSWVTAPLKAIADPEMYVALVEGAAYSARALELHPVRSNKAVRSAVAAGSS